MTVMNTVIPTGDTTLGKLAATVRNTPLYHRVPAADKWFNEHPEEAADALELYRTGYPVVMIFRELEKQGFPVQDRMFREWLRRQTSGKHNG